MLFSLLFLLFAADPNQARALLQKGLLALQHGQLTDARSTLEEASHADGGNPLVWTSLAEAYFRTGELDKAESAAARAEQIGNKDPLIVHALALVYFNIAQTLLRKQDFTDAANLLSTGLRADPKNSQLLLGLGAARYGQRRFDEAIACFLKVIQIDPTVQQPYVFLGKMLDQAGGALPEITTDDEAWVAKEPGNSKAYLELAKALLAGAGSTPQPEELLRRSISLDPYDWESHYQLGVLLASKREYREAAEQLTQSIDLNGKEAMPHYHLARVYDRLGEAQRAATERAIHQRLTGASH